MPQRNVPSIRMFPMFPRMQMVLTIKITIEYIFREIQAACFRFLTYNLAFIVSSLWTRCSIKKKLYVNFRIDMNSPFPLFAYVRILMDHLHPSKSERNEGSFSHLILWGSGKYAVCSQEII